MKAALYSLLFGCMAALSTYGQTNFLISTPAEMKLVGMQSYFFISHKSYITYNPDGGTLKIIVNMQELSDPKKEPLKADGIEFNNNVIQDTVNMIFTGSVDPSLMEPGKNVNENYTFTVTGKIDYRGGSYPTQIVCSYGGKMIRSTTVVSLNINLEILKMEVPMFVPFIKNMVDNVMVTIMDGTVNIVQQ